MLRGCIERENKDILEGGFKLFLLAIKSCQICFLNVEVGLIERTYIIHLFQASTLPTSLSFQTSLIVIVDRIKGRKAEPSRTVIKFGRVSWKSVESSSCANTQGVCSMI